MIVEIHQALARFNHQRLRPSLGEHFNPKELQENAETLRREIAFVEAQRDLVRAQLGSVPDVSNGTAGNERAAKEFVAWFENLEHTGPGQHEPLFDWLAETATTEEMQWFLTQEVAGEAGFEDLVALTQIQMPTTAKLELARNYWDEMGRGKAGGMHGPMLADLADALHLHAQATPIVWQAQALGNLMMALACHRHYAYRLGVSGDVRRYYAIHATLDVQHSQAWNREVIATLCIEPGVARAIAEGALLRLQAGADCFAAYRAHFGLD